MINKKEEIRICGTSKYVCMFHENLIKFQDKL